MAFVEELPRLVPLEELKSDGSDRWDILKIGVESAWEELRAAFEMAAAKNVGRKEPTSDEAAG